MIPQLALLCGLGVVLTRSAIAAEGGGTDTFAADSAFVKQYTPVIELSDNAGARVLVAPGLQGRVLTSTAVGDDGPSYGWINKDLLASGKQRPHINAYGGEDRFWIGPEGGQFSIFFSPGSKFDMEHWQTPAPLDTEPFEVVSQDQGQATFRRELKLVNYSGTKFVVRVDRQVRLLTPEQAWKNLKLEAADGVKLVAYESDNRLTNAGAEPWKRSSGLLSIWILGMFNASPDAIVVLPFRKGPESELGKEIESGYFGDVPASRLVVKDGVAYFKADAKYRSKIGVSPARVLPVIGSWDSGKKLLTLVQFDLPEKPAEYANSQWKLQDNPFAGDAANSYNDGPNALGTSLGNFYEMESSSPAVELGAGQTVEHVHRTMHLTGDVEQLDRVAKATLGVSLAEIEAGLGK